MRHVQQPAYSNQCGQACIAMLSGKDLDAVVDFMSMKGKTRTRDLVKTIRTGLGEMRGMQCPDKLIRLMDMIGTYPKYCIVKACSPDRRQAHWMLVFNGELHDPATDGSPWPTCTWKITSYLPLTGGICST